MAIKVRVLRGVQAGLTGMSGLVTLSSGVTACTAEQPAHDDVVQSDDSALTIQNPGTGVLSLAWDYATPIGFSFAAKNSTDEYVRAGEKMTFAIPSYFLWQRLYPNAAVPDDVSRQLPGLADLRPLGAHELVHRQQARAGPALRAHHRRRRGREAHPRGRQARRGREPRARVHRLARRHARRHLVDRSHATACGRARGR